MVLSFDSSYVVRGRAQGMDLSAPHFWCFHCSPFPTPAWLFELSEGGRGDLVELLPSIQKVTTIAMPDLVPA